MAQLRPHQKVSFKVSKEASITKSSLKFKSQHSDTHPTDTHLPLLENIPDCLGPNSHSCLCSAKKVTGHRPKDCHHPPSATSEVNHTEDKTQSSQSANTCFNPDIWAPDFPRRILCSTEIVVVVDKAIEGRWRERVELQRPIGMDVTDVWDIIDVIPSGEVPAKGGTGGPCCWTGDYHPHSAGEGHLLNGVVHKVEAGSNIFCMSCRGEEKKMGDQAL